MKRGILCLLWFALVTFPSCKKQLPVAPPPDLSQPPSTSDMSRDLKKPEIQLTANPTRVVRGKTATLQWTSSHASTIVIDNGVGNVGEAGSVTVAPRETTTFTAIAKGAGGEGKASVRVTVTTK